MENKKTEEHRHNVQQSNSYIYITGKKGVWKIRLFYYIANLFKKRVYTWFEPHTFIGVSSPLFQKLEC